MNKQLVQLAKFLIHFFRDKYFVSGKILWPNIWVPDRFRLIIYPIHNASYAETRRLSLETQLSNGIKERDF